MFLRSLKRLARFLQRKSHSLTDTLYDRKTIVDCGDTLVEANESYWAGRAAQGMDPLPEFLMPVETVAFQKAWINTLEEFVYIPAVVYVTKQPAYPVTDESAFELRDDGTGTLPSDVQIVVKMLGVWGTGGGWRLMRGMWTMGNAFYYILFYIPVVWTDVADIWDSVHRSLERAGEDPMIAPLSPRPTIDIYPREDGLSEWERERRERVWRLQRRQRWHPYYYRDDEDGTTIDEDADVVSGGDME